MKYKNFNGELLEKNFKGIILILKNLNQLTHNYFSSNEKKETHRGQEKTILKWSK